MNKQLQDLFAELETTQKQFWNISKEVGLFLQDLIIQNNLKTVLEIGTSNGYSGLHLASALQKTNGHLYTIESNFKKRYPLAQANFQKSGLTNISLILGHAPEAIPEQPTNFDLAFFDATKCEHLLYYNALKDRISPSGFIITDNYLSHHQELQSFAEAIKNDPQWTTEESSLGTGLLIAQKLQ